MDLLGEQREWIGSYVHQALAEALQWISQAPNAKAKENARFEDDGSSLRVKSTEQFFVQLDKIDQADSPIHVWIADTRTHLRVTIAASAAERFQRVQGRRITEGTLGGIFQLTDFEIVAQHYGPKKTKITMLIHELKHLGSDGSGRFGSPSSIESLYEIQGLLDELQMYRANAANNRREAGRLAMLKRSSTRSPSPSTDASQNVGEGVSQADFATQAPLALARRNRALRIPAVESRDHDRADQADLAGSESEGISEKPALRNNVTRNGVSNKPTATGGKKNVQQLVENRKKANAASSVQSKPGKVKINAQMPQVSHIDENGQQRSNLLTLLRGLSESSTPSPESPAAKIDLSKAETRLASPKRQLQVNAIKSPQQQQQPVLALSNASAEVSERFEPTTKDAVSRIHIGILPKQASVVARKNSSRGVTKHHEHQTRISRREISIPKNQKILLERSDAWIPPEPGHRVPTANIPISILEALNHKVDRKAVSSIESSRGTKSLSPSTQLCPIEDKGSGEDESGSDEPFTATQWPLSSPEQEELPPDSSIESINHSTRIESPRASHKTTNHQQVFEPPHDPTRRFSTGSKSPATDMSGRRNPMRKVEAVNLSPQTLSPSPAAHRQSLDRAAKHSPNSSRTGRSSPGDSDAHNDTEDASLSDASSEISRASHSVNRERYTKRASLTASKDVKIVIPAKTSPVKNGISGTKNLPHQPSRDDLASSTVSGTRAGLDEVISLSSTSSDSDSELETTLPQGLATFKEASNRPPKAQSLPSTAPQKNDPVMQVKQTPYDKGIPDLQVKRSRWPERFQRDSQPRQNEESASRMPRSMNSLRTSEAKTADRTSVNMSNSEEHDKTIGVKVAAMDKERIEALSSEFVSDRSAIQSSGIDSSADRAISSIEDTFLPSRVVEEPQVLATPDVRPPEIVASNMQSLKRKASEPLSLFPKTTKRREHGLARAASDLSYLDKSTQDLKENAKLMKTNFLTSIAKPSPSESESDFEVTRQAPEAANEVKTDASVEKNALMDKAALPDRLSLKAANGRTASDASQNTEVAPVTGEADEEYPTTEAPFNKMPAKPAPTLKVAGKTAEPTESHCFVRGSDEESSNEEAEASDDDDKVVYEAEVPRSTVLQKERAERNVIEDNQYSDDVAVISERGELRNAQSPRLPAELIMESTKANTKIKQEAAGHNRRLPHAPTQQSTDPLGTSVVPSPSPMLKTNPTLGVGPESQSRGTHSKHSRIILTPLRSPQMAAIGTPPPAHSSQSAPLTSVVVENVARDETRAQHFRAQAFDQVHPPLSASVGLLTSFERFRKSYPEYPGNFLHFENICNKLKDLVRADRMRYPALWDDFIIRSKTDYPRYLLQCTDKAVDPLSYERYYETDCQKLKYTKGLITPKIIMPTISSTPHSPTDLQYPQVPAGHGGAARQSHGQVFGDLVPDPPPSRYSLHQPRNDRVMSSRREQDNMNVAGKKPSNTGPGAIDVSRKRRHGEVVDLTGDDPHSPLKETRVTSPPKPSRERARRSLPWSAEEETTSSGKLPASSPIKVKSMFSQRPSPSQPFSQEPFSEHNTSAVNRSRAEPSSSKNSPGMLPQVLKRATQRAVAVEESSTPSDRVSKVPAKRVTRPERSPHLGPHESYHHEDIGYGNKSYRMYSGNATAITPGRHNSYARFTAVVNQRAVTDGGDKKGWKHDPFNLLL